MNEIIDNEEIDLEEVIKALVDEMIISTANNIEKDVVVYTRYSSTKQNDTSTIAQLQEIWNFCKNKKYRIVYVYWKDRAKTGTNSDDRKDFLKMIEDSKIKTKTWTGVVVYQLDRFARNKYDSVIYKRDLKR